MKKKILIASLLTFSASALIGIGATFANFASTVKVNQTVKSSGQLATSIFLNVGVWEKDAAEFMIYTWNNGGDKWIPSVSLNEDGYYVFQLQTSVYTNLIFARMNPNRTADSWDVGNAWNKTGDLTYDTNNPKNLYVISGWGTAQFSDSDDRTIADGNWSNSVYQ